MTSYNNVPCEILTYKCVCQLLFTSIYYLGSKGGNKHFLEVFLVKYHRKITKTIIRLYWKISYIYHQLVSYSYVPHQNRCALEPMSVDVIWFRKLKIHIYIMYLLSRFNILHITYIFRSD